MFLKKIIKMIRILKKKLKRKKVTVTSLLYRHAI